MSNPVQPGDTFINHILRFTQDLTQFARAFEERYGNELRAVAAGLQELARQAAPFVTACAATLESHGPQIRKAAAIAKSFEEERRRPPTIYLPLRHH